MSLKQNDEFLEKLKEEYEDIGKKIQTLEDLKKRIETLKDLQKPLRDYEYVAIVRCPLSGEVLAEVSTNNFEIFEQKIYQLKKVVDKDARQIEKDLDEWYDK